LSDAIKPVADQDAFDRFLLTLDPNRARAGEQYETIRRKLVKYFEWRGCTFADEPADEVLGRMIDKIGQGEQIRDPMSFCYGIARLVLLETRRDYARERAAISELHYAPAHGPTEAEDNALHCLNGCLDATPADNRKLILAYYRLEGGAKIEARKQLAEELSIPLNALRIRAHRLREKLEDCVQACMQEKKR
jgi:DNA-directed RNA polymerase specialized sigma24 family protein